MKPHKFLFVLLAFFFFSARVHALTPPLPQKELEEEASLIVEGEVETPVRCLGLEEKTQCFDKLNFTAPLKVQKVIKGSATTGKTLEVRFYYKDYGNSRCVGDQGAVLNSGDQGIYYLKKGQGDTYFPFHWSGVKLDRRGTGSLPRCP